MFICTCGMFFVFLVIVSITEFVFLNSEKNTVQLRSQKYAVYRLRKSNRYSTPKNLASDFISSSFIVFILGRCAVSIYI